MLILTEENDDNRKGKEKKCNMLLEFSGWSLTTWICGARWSLRQIFAFCSRIFNDLKKQGGTKVKKLKKKKSLVFLLSGAVTHGTLVNIQKGSTLASVGTGAEVQCVTSPSLVSTVRTRMLLFTWASEVLVSRLVSTGKWTEGQEGALKQKFKNEIRFLCFRYKATEMVDFSGSIFS